MCTCCLPLLTISLSPPEEMGGLHQVVSEAMKEDAIEYAKVSHRLPSVQLPFHLVPAVLLVGVLKGV